MCDTVYANLLSMIICMCVYRAVTFVCYPWPRFDTGYSILEELLCDERQRLPLGQLWSCLITVACQHTGEERLRVTKLLMRMLEMQTKRYVTGCIPDTSWDCIAFPVHHGTAFLVHHVTAFPVHHGTAFPVRMGLHSRYIMGLRSRYIMGLHSRYIMGLRSRYIMGLHSRYIMGLHSPSDEVCSVRPFAQPGSTCWKPSGPDSAEATLAALHHLNEAIRSVNQLTHHHRE